MAPYQGTTGSQNSWEDTYRATQPDDLPWNAGMVDSDLQDFLEHRNLGPGQAYDLGCGPGNDAAYLAEKGWDVTAVDLSPTAMQLARMTAEKKGVAGKVKFLVSDVLALKATGDGFLVHDRGCFHTLPSDLWGDYARMVSGLLGQEGWLTLKVFSTKEPEGARPYRFAPGELQKVFEGDFHMVDVREGIFHGPRRPYSLFAVFKKFLKKG